ncbi:MAG: 4Fe-4S dicluster domain-containing protein [Deltaproteobacteria bacterium]|nr:MAG: 4Fe-4S dicluster domain-containing protein [Deltaproteobacteria bacterium]
MTKRVITKAELPNILVRLMDHYRVYAPVLQNDMINFQLLAGDTQADFSLPNTRLSPKTLMLPQSERMFEFTLDKAGGQGRILQEIEKDYSPRAIFGIRPCDAKAFQLLDLNFDTDSYRDAWWVRRRQITTLVGFGCSEPCDTCFCSSVGSGPFSPDGLDVIFTDVGENYLVDTLTDKGERLVALVSAEGEAEENVVATARELKKAAVKSISSVVPTESLDKHSVSALFEAAFWDGVQFACINCGVCTFVCPTCWCFDIQDEVSKDNGVRVRNWDACMFSLFTLHGSGHNPRSQKLSRVRQRFMHKLKYFVDKYNSGAACVGCGRCVQQCPVNIDIREVFKLMNDFKV